MVARRRLDSVSDQRRQQRRQTAKLGVQAPLGFSSIHRGGLEINSEEGLEVNGSARTTGRQDIDGLLNGTGTLAWSGPVNISGTLETSGDTVLGGDVQIDDTLVVNAETTLRGDLSLESDMNVEPGGTITVEGSGAPMVIGVLTGGVGGGFAGINFGQAVLASTGDTVQISTPTSGLGVGTNRVEMRVGSRSVLVDGSSIKLIGLTRLPAGVAADDVAMSSDGTLYRDS